MIKQSYLKSAYAIEVVFLWLVNFLDFCFGRLGQSFPEGIIKPYDGTSLTIGNRPIAVVQSVTVFRMGEKRTSGPRQKIIILRTLL